MKIRILEAGNELGLGGTALVMENFCRYLDKSRFHITVVGFKEGGVRGDILQNLGFKVVAPVTDHKAWEKLLSSCEVLHWHGPGQLEPAVFEAVRQHKPPLVIQTNVFGMADGSAYYDLIDADLYVSRMVLVRRQLQDGPRGQKYLSKRYVLYNPVDLARIEEHLPSPDEVDHCRRELGLEGYQVLGRVGRAADAKFHSVVIQMMPQLVKKIPRIKFVIVGFTDYMQYLARKFEVQDYFVWLDPTPDLRTLLTYYRVMDVYLGASAMGESFGMNLAEAMVCGLPVVAISTPDQDNAQIELVDNGLNGLVVEAYPRLVALACQKLLTDATLSQRLSRAARVKVQAYAAEKSAAALENFICQHLGLAPQAGAAFNESPLPLSWSDDLAADYLQRLDKVFAKPSLDDKIRRRLRYYGGRAKLKVSRWLV